MEGRCLSLIQLCDNPTSIFTTSHPQLCFLSRFSVAPQSQQQQQKRVMLISTNVTQVLCSTVPIFFFCLYVYVDFLLLCQSVFITLKVITCICYMNMSGF